MPERKDKKGILNTATTEQCVISGDIYPVGVKAKPFITKIRAGTAVYFTVKDGEVTFIAAEKPTEQKAQTEHTAVTPDQMSAERDAYNEKGKVKFTPKKEESFECGGCKRLIFRYPCPVCHYDPEKTPHVCRECIERPKCKKKMLPDGECIHDAINEPPVNKFAGALDDKTADEVNAMRTKTYDKQITVRVTEKDGGAQITEIEPVPGAVSLMVHINMGSYSNFELKVEGSSGEHARQLLIQEAERTIPLVTEIMKQAMVASKKVVY